MDISFHIQLFHVKYIGSIAISRLIEEKAPGSHSVEVSVVEIYNNDIRDLLSKDPNAKHDVVTGTDGGVNFPTVICK